VGLGISCRAEEAFYIELKDTQAVGEMLNALRPVLENEKIEKTGHNIKGTLLALRKHDIVVAGPLFDPMLAHYLIEPEASHDLAVLCAMYLNYTLSAGSVSVAERMCERADVVMQVVISFDLYFEML
jgi:DNA polymerase I